MEIQQKIRLMPNLGKGIAYNILIALIALVLTWIFKGPNIDIEFHTAVFVSAVLFVLFSIIVIASVAKQSRANSTRLFRRLTPSRNDARINPYKYVRHPIYSGIIFLLNPALAVYFGSWLYLAACFLIYFIWRNLAKSEELNLAKILGSDYNEQDTRYIGRTARYSQYRLKTNLFFPNLFAINKPLAFILSGALIFILAFVVLNFSSLSFRYIGWETNTQSSQLNPEPSVMPNANGNEISPVELPLAEDIKYDKANSIVIEKLGIDAPLVLSQGQTQKELNADLDKGVIIYPGSALPGETGNFFVTGHSSVYFWNKTPYGRIFATLDKLEAGDRIVVYYDQYKYEYEITKKLVLSPNDVHLFGTDERIITLMTCWPIGTNLKRLVLEGKLVR